MSFHTYVHIVNPLTHQAIWLSRESEKTAKSMSNNYNPHPLLKYKPHTAQAIKYINK